MRPFKGIDDLRNRIPGLRKDELRKLAAVGALNFIHDSIPLKKLKPEVNSKYHGSS